MSIFQRLFVAVVGLGLLYPAATPGFAQQLGSQPDHGQIATAVARILEQGHYSRRKLDAELSKEFFENYLRMLDYNRLYFLQSDIEEFRRKYEATLGDMVLRGDISPANDIFSRFKTRVEERVAKNLELIKEPFNFSSGKHVQLNRKDAPWPVDQADADRLWRNRIEGELLQEHLSDSKLDDPQVIVTRRYNQVLRNVQEQEQEDIIKTFLAALAQTYDPHSDYLSPSDMENFSIAMRLSLVGVGAVLRSDEGYARVLEVVPGGPADRDGRLKVNDRIAAVAQGDEEFEDTVNMKLDKVVEKIRGKKGTTVRLLVAPANATDPSQREVIEIVRDEVKLRDQEARAELIEMPAEGSSPPTRIGWITLPSFYANFDRDGDTPPKSTTQDVSRLLKRLTKEGIDGLVIDLRRDGGGSLEEAINLTGLFIPEGPVVQVKNANGQVMVNNDEDSSTLYTGPLVVLMNRLSASASEIFAAALQDYGRAIIVGDERSFGKGTVQQLVEVGRFMPFFSLSGAEAGSLKLTVQKFYRVRGGSTQLNGVESDIVLPSLTDSPEIGEGALINPLSYDEVAPRLITPVPGSPVQFLEELRNRSLLRVQNEPEFHYIKDDMQRIRERIESNKLSLNKAERKAEAEAEKQRKEERKTARKERGPALDARAYEITLETVDLENLPSVAFERPPKRNSMEAAMEEEESGSEPGETGDKEVVTPDPIRVEALRIMQDIVGLSSAKSGTKTVQVSPNTANEPSVAD